MTDAVDRGARVCGLSAQKDVFLAKYAGAVYVAYDETDDLFDAMDMDRTPDAKHLNPRNDPTIASQSQMIASLPPFPFIRMAQHRSPTFLFKKCDHCDVAKIWS